MRGVKSRAKQTNRIQIGTVNEQKDDMKCRADLRVMAKYLTQADFT